MSENQSRVLSPEAEVPSQKSQIPNPKSQGAPRWAWWVATGFGSGLLKPAPGTWGSLAAVLLWLLWRRLAWFWPGPVPGGWLYYGILPAMALTWIAIRSSNAVVRESGLKDPGFIVIDEWAGQWFALVPLLLITNMIEPPIFLDWRVLVPFLFFRLFDIWKPGLIRELQVLPGGLGIVIDDVVAGLYAAFVTAMLLPFLR